MIDWVKLLQKAKEKHLDSVCYFISFMCIGAALFLMMVYHI